MLLGIAAIQLLLWILVIPQALELTRHGDMSVVAVLECALSMVVLLAASALVVLRRQPALWLHLVAASLALAAGSPSLGPAPLVAIGVSALSALLLWRWPLRPGTVA